MAYYDGWKLTLDEDFIARVRFCAQVEGLGSMWGLENTAAIAAAPGFADAYAYALATGVENPGRAQEVISDGQILAAVQAAAPAPAGG